MTPPRPPRLLLASVLATALLGGCTATGAGAEAMVPPVMASPSCGASPVLDTAVTLGSVGGGEETHALGTSKVSNDDLAEALRLTLDQHGMLAPDPARARFRLDVYLLELDQPRSGFTTEVVTFVRYTLVALDDERTVMDDVVQASFVLGAGDVFSGTKRMRIVNEGSMRRNLADFVELLCTQAAAGEL